MGSTTGDPNGVQGHRHGRSERRPLRRAGRSAGLRVLLVAALALATQTAATQAYDVVVDSPLDDVVVEPQPGDDRTREDETSEGQVLASPTIDGGTAGAAPTAEAAEPGDDDEGYSFATGVREPFDLGASLACASGSGFSLPRLGSLGLPGLGGTRPIFYANVAEGTVLIAAGWFAGLACMGLAGYAAGGALLMATGWFLIAWRRRRDDEEDDASIGTALPA
jgi:hypothetical protein